MIVGMREEVVVGMAARGGGDEQTPFVFFLRDSRPFFVSRSACLALVRFVSPLIFKLAYSNVVSARVDGFIASNSRGCDEEGEERGRS